MLRGLWALQHAKQLGFASMKPREEAIQQGVIRAAFEDGVEVPSQRGGSTWAGTA